MRPIPHRSRTRALDPRDQPGYARRLLDTTPRLPTSPRMGSDQQDTESGYNPYAGAARFFSGKPKPLTDLGDVSSASGWKVAVFTDPLLGRFAGLSHGTFELRSVARCEKDEFHLPPVVGCECGFHAMYTRSRAERLIGFRAGLVLLEVEMYGEIVLHREGMRAQEQDIHAIHLDPRCSRPLCRRAAAGLRQKGKKWRSACVAHLDSGVTLNEIRNALKLDVSLRLPAEHD